MKQYVIDFAKATDVDGFENSCSGRVWFSYQMVIDKTGIKVFENDWRSDRKLWWKKDRDWSCKRVQKEVFKRIHEIEKDCDSKVTYMSTNFVNNK